MCSGLREYGLEQPSPLQLKHLNAEPGENVGLYHSTTITKLKVLYSLHFRLLIFVISLFCQLLNILTLIFFI
jgi:hypothetical protein